MEEIVALKPLTLFTTLRLERFFQTQSNTFNPNATVKIQITALFYFY